MTFQGQAHTRGKECEHSLAGSKGETQGCSDKPKIQAEGAGLWWRSGQRVPLWEGATAVGNKESPVLPRAPEMVRRKLDGAAPRAELVWEAGRRSQRPGAPAFHQGWFLVTVYNQDWGRSGSSLASQSPRCSSMGGPGRGRPRGREVGIVYWVFLSSGG